MIAVLVVTGCLVAVGVAVWASRRVKHPANLTARDHDAGASESERLYRGADRPAGPDAEDPPTAVPNRREPEPPTGRAAHR